MLERLIEDVRAVKARLDSEEPTTDEELDGLLERMQLLRRQINLERSNLEASRAAAASEVAIFQREVDDERSP